MKLRTLSTILTLALAFGIGFVGCEQDMSGVSDVGLNEKSVSTEDVTSALKGGKGNGGGNAGETAYTCDAHGTEAGLVGECPSVMSYQYTLWAGKHNDAGTVTIWADDVNIYVEYNTNETADLGEAHVYVWTNESDLPDKRPAPGQAPYKAENINADSYTFTIPAADLGVDLCGSTLYISTHAALVGEGGSDDGTGNAGETAYTGDPTCFDNQKGAWWGYAAYTVECFYDVSGFVYEDANDNGTFDAGENVFEGINVTVANEATTTDANGYYEFTLPAGGDYLIESGQPAGDYAAYEGDGGVYISGLSACLEDQNFGFVPLYDLSVDLDLLGDLNCVASATITINGQETALLENQRPGTAYEVVVTAYDVDGNILATESASGALTEDTALSFELSGWTCPQPPVDCNECVDGELVANGSFENGVLDGWVHSGISGYGGNSIDFGNWAGAASDGNWVIDLVGTGNPVGGFVEQTLCTTPGEEYVLTFDLWTKGASGLLVTVDGNSQQFTSVGSYTSYTMTFTATSSSTTLRLAADGSYNYLTNNVFLDNVSIACGDGGPGTGGGSETAYMFGNWSFCEPTQGNQSRWGWANYIEPGQTITETIYAGAGQCDITKGTPVGTATLQYAPPGPFPGAGSLTLTISYYAPYSMNNIHVNIGDPFAISPSMTSNGNFNNNPTGVSYPTSSFSQTYQMSGAGEYVIVHMEAIQ